MEKFGKIPLSTILFACPGLCQIYGLVKIGKISAFPKKKCQKYLLVHHYFYLSWTGWQSVISIPDTEAKNRATGTKSNVFMIQLLFHTCANEYFILKPNFVEKKTMLSGNHFFPGSSWILFVWTDRLDRKKWISGFLFCTFYSQKILIVGVCRTVHFNIVLFQHSELYSRLWKKMLPKSSYK